MAEQSLINSSQDMKLVRALIESEKRIFTVEDCRTIGKFDSKNEGYLRQLLMKLEKNSWILRLRPGLYALDSAISRSVLHEFEIAMHLAKEIAISHGSAFHYYELTDQLIKDVYVTAPKTVGIPLGRPLKINSVEYHFIHVEPNRYFGVQEVWITNDAKIKITDLERTLLDGLSRPKYFGGFQEVLSGFKLAIPKIDIEKIIGYAQRLDLSICKRLGWTLDHCGVQGSQIKGLNFAITGSYTSLVANRKSSGPFNQKWLVRENIL